MDCFRWNLVTAILICIVSISALSDRGLLRFSQCRQANRGRCFNIRSFGSWIASTQWHAEAYGRCPVSISALSDRGLLRNVPTSPATPTPSFNIRSFGSWIASFFRGCGKRTSSAFQYPLFRIVDCFNSARRRCCSRIGVSISALSDRGLLPIQARLYPHRITCFNIRSFGSWIASDCWIIHGNPRTKFQYPLFRIVDCFPACHGHRLH